MRRSFRVKVSHIGLGESYRSALSTAALAPVVSWISLNENFLSTSAPSTLTFGARPLRADTKPRSMSTVGVTSVPASNAAAIFARVISSGRGRNGLTVRPRFLPYPRRLGKFLDDVAPLRRFLRPARAFCPFVPRPEVLPRLPPRPTRVLERAVVRLRIKICHRSFSEASSAPRLRRVRY